MLGSFNSIKHVPTLRSVTKVGTRTTKTMLEVAIYPSTVIRLLLKLKELYWL